MPAEKPLFLVLPTRWPRRGSWSQRRCSAWPNLSKETHLLLAGFLLPWEAAAVPRGHNSHWDRSSLGVCCTPALIANEPWEPDIICQPGREAQPINCHRFYTEDKLMDSNNSNTQNLCTYWIEVGFIHSSWKKWEYNNFSFAAHAFATTFYTPSKARLKTNKPKKGEVKNVILNIKNKQTKIPALELEN